MELRNRSLSAGGPLTSPGSATGGALTSPGWAAGGALTSPGWAAGGALTALGWAGSSGGPAATAASRTPILCHRFYSRFYSCLTCSPENRMIHYKINFIKKFR